MPTRFASLLPDLIQDRHAIHAHPEIAFEEVRTSAFVAQKLRSYNFDEVLENFGDLGVVGVLHGKAKGGCIAFRADMDALPMQEMVPEGQHRPYVSCQENRFHGCGHDGHTIMLLGAARYLSLHRNFSGTLIFVFQPGEENASGAKAMIQAGLFTRFPIQAIYGLHNFPSLAYGKIFVNEAETFSGADNFRITIFGKGSHGAMPQCAIDPIYIAARLILDLQSIISRNIAPKSIASLSFGEIHAGSACNVIPDSLMLSGTLRTYDPNVRSLAKARISALLEGLRTGFATRIVYEELSGAPPIINDDKLAKAAVLVLQSAMGEEAAVLCRDPQSPSEDFAFFLEHVPGIYALLGQGDSPMLHHPNYDFDDRLIACGIAYWVSLAEGNP